MQKLLHMKCKISHGLSSLLGDSFHQPEEDLLLRRRWRRRPSDSASVQTAEETRLVSPPSSVVMSAAAKERSNIQSRRPKAQDKFLKQNRHQFIRGGLVVEAILKLMK